MAHNPFSNVSQAAHSWSSGDFSAIIRDKRDDEIGKLGNDLNTMAEQLENLLDRRQEISVLEERNRLARDLHDSVKQQALLPPLSLRLQKRALGQIRSGLLTIWSRLKS